MQIMFGKVDERLHALKRQFETPASLFR